MPDELYPLLNGLFDWSAIGQTRAKYGYVYHTTSTPKAIKIMKDGYIKPLGIGISARMPWIISFTLDPLFGSTVDIFGVTFIFSEHTIREKYRGREVPAPHIEIERWRKAWLEEMEIEVGERVYLSDCLEILPETACARKYGLGYKYHYKDVREQVLSKKFNPRRLHLSRPHS